MHEEQLRWKGELGVPGFYMIPNCFQAEVLNVMFREERLDRAALHIFSVPLRKQLFQYWELVRRA